MSTRPVIEAAKQFWVGTRDISLTCMGIGTIFVSFASSDKFGVIASGILAGVGIAMLDSVWDGIAQRARAKAMIETINMMAKDGGFSAELRVTHRGERSTIHLKAAEETK